MANYLSYDKFPGHVQVFRHSQTLCAFWFNVASNNFSVISRWCLVVTESSMLTFIVLPHWSIMPQTLDMIPHPVTSSWHWVDRSWLYPGKCECQASGPLYCIVLCRFRHFWCTSFWPTSIAVLSLSAWPARQTRQNVGRSGNLYICARPYVT